ncbi:MAG: beta-lactamase family protein [Saprospiraceae bacterium]|nr:beta-lactamase family protein [Saprospiraceae bacterium]
MKKTFLLLLIASSVNLCAQQADLATHHAVNDSLVAMFNRQAFEESYNLLSPNVQKKLDLKKWVKLLKNDLFMGLGQVKKSEFLENQNGAYLYKWSFEKMIIQTSIVVYQSKLIEGIYFKPFVEKAKKRTVAAATDNALKTGLDRTVDSVARTYIENVNTAGLSIGIIKNGETFTYHYGETDKKNPKLPNDKTIYEIGSISKTFTGLLLAHAVLQNEVNLEDDIRKYLPQDYPNLVFKGQPILIKHLTNHTARLQSFPVEDITAQKGYDASNPYKHYTSDMVLSYLHKVKLDTFAGIKSEYSNFATGLLGIILEKKFKKSYADLLQTYITTPLSMTDTKITIPKADFVRFAKPYDEAGNPANYWDITGLAAAGAIRSTLSDMLTYAKANMTATDSAVLLTQKATFKDSPNNETGLFWQLSTTSDGNQIIWHNGGTGGFRTFCGFIKSKNLAVVLLSNGGDDVTQKGLELMKVLRQ